MKRCKAAWRIYNDWCQASASVVRCQQHYQGSDKETVLKQLRLAEDAQHQAMIKHYKSCNECLGYIREVTGEMAG